MYGTIRHEIRINRPAADVWALAGDAAKLHHWFPGITDCTVDGNQRVIITASGAPMPEEILLCVIDLGDPTCLVVYSTEADPRAMALVIGGGTAGALRELKRQMERQMEDDTPEGTN